MLGDIIWVCFSFFVVDVHLLVCITAGRARYYRDIFSILMAGLYAVALPVNLCWVGHTHVTDLC